ncbi:MAG TPA: hypothetical protein VGH87_18585, partial [Polyangiaceae bacterium]
MRLRVLVVDRDASSAARRASELTESGYDAVGVAASGAAEALMRESVDSIVCSDSVRVEIERIYGALIPVVRGEGQASAQIAKTLARLARRSMSPTAQLSLASQLDDALANATLALEPVVHLRTGGLFAHRAALFPASLSVDEMERIASELGRVRELRRAMRSLAFEAAERGANVFLDLTLEDLMDPVLYDETPQAKSMTLVIAERDVQVLAEKDARERLRTLRGLGFDLVVRIGTDIAGLTTVG